jgi:uncharacterized repeat protein (TIGR01451 family)
VNQIVQSAGSLTNTATIAAPTGFIDTNLANNSATDTNTIGVVTPQGDLSITKTDGLTTVTAGQVITYTIVARNNGSVTATNAVVSDTMPTNLSNISWTSVAAGGATDNQASGTGNINDTVTLTAGSSITYTVTGKVVAPSTTLGSAIEFDFNGSSSTDGTDGNSRTFTKDGVTVTARAFSRTDSNGSWAAGYLGSYGGGLGVTDSGESTSAHRVDNVGSRDNYVLFQFSESVILDRAYLQYVVDDSDMSVWIGNSGSSITALSDSTLSGLGFTEVNNASNSSDRWADVNAGNYAGNTIVIAASTADTTPDDQFKIRYLDVNKIVQTTGSLTNTATIAAPTGFIDTNLSNNSATDTDTILGQGVSVCGVLGSAEKMTFRYGNGTRLLTGGKWNNQDGNARILNNRICDDDSSSFIRVSNKSNCNDLSGKEYFEGQVGFGSDFTASVFAPGANSTSFDAKTYIHYFDYKGGAYLGSVQYDTSSTQPMQLGDELSGSTLVGYDGVNGHVTCS